MASNDRIKLLMVTECFGGGVLAYLTQLCNELCDEFDVYLAYSTRAQTPENYRDNLDNRIHLIYVEGFGDISPVGVMRSVAKLRGIAEDVNPDIIHLHSSLAGVIGRIAFSKRKVPLVYTPHGYAFALLGSGLKSKLFYLVEKVLANRALTLNCCESEDEVARTLGRNTAYIETGLNVDALDKSLESIEAKEFDRFTVFSLGKAYVQKQPWLFNRIAELVPEADFIWIGGGELEGQLTAPNVTCTGWLPREKALSIAKGANAFILCSKGEAISMSLLEAMFLEKLILVSNVMGNNSVIEDGINGYVCDFAEEYALHILEAIKEYPFDLASKARADIDSIYNTETMVERFSAFYEKQYREGIG